MANSQNRESAEQRPARTGTTAYMMSRFPKLTETFVLYEMLEMERLGVRVEIYPLRRERAVVVHEEARPLVQRAHFSPLFSWAILLAHLHFLRRRPAAYLGALWMLLRANFGSLRFFTAAIVFFPKAVYFARHMQQQGIEHIHAHFASHPAAVAFTIHRLTGIPYSFTAHGSDLHRDRHMLQEKVAGAAFVATISRYNREMIVRECGEACRDKLRIVHCGIDADVFGPRAAPTPFEEGRSPPAILCTGTLHEVKGQAYLVEACRHLRDRRVDFVCHLVGDGPDRQKLEAQIEQAGLSDHFRLHGQQTRGELQRLLQSIDVVTAPSVQTRCGRREGIPVVLMEAMGKGIPVVASRLSGIPELVEDEQTGLLTPPRDAKALADAIERLLRDAPLRRRLADAGRRRVQREFNLRTNAAQLATHFFPTEVLSCPT